MFRTRLAIGLTAIALLGVSACSSDSVADKIQGAATETTVSDGDPATNDTASGDTAAPGVTSGGDSSGGLPTGLVPEECRAIYNSFIGAMASAMSPGSNVDLDSVFGDAKAKLPDEIQKDVAYLAGVFGDFAKQMEGKQNDPAAAAAAIALFSDPKVQEASDRVNAYFETTCPE